MYVHKSNLEEEEADTHTHTQKRYKTLYTKMDPAVIFEEALQKSREDAAKLCDQMDVVLELAKLRVLPGMDIDAKIHENINMFTLADLMALTDGIEDYWVDKYGSRTPDPQKARQEIFAGRVIPFHTTIARLLVKLDASVAKKLREGVPITKVHNELYEQLVELNKVQIKGSPGPSFSFYKDKDCQAPYKQAQRWYACHGVSFS